MTNHDSFYIITTCYVIQDALSVFIWVKISSDNNKAMPLLEYHEGDTIQLLIWSHPNVLDLHMNYFGGKSAWG